jgi:hypothetical protein
MGKAQEENNMKKFLAKILILVTIIASISMTVSAASVDDEIVSLTKLGFNFMEEVLGDYSDKIKGIFNIILDVAEMCPTDTPEKEEPPKDDIPEETPEIIVPPTTTSVEVRAGIFGYESTYVVYGEVVPCHWVHNNNSETMVEVLSAVQSEEFLDMGQVAELFVEEFGPGVRVTRQETYIKAFLIEDLIDTSNKFLLPVKEEGLPVEVWEAFVIQFADEFTSVEVLPGVYDSEATYWVYGETVPCNWVHTNDFATMVEVLSDVQSEVFLTTEDVEELFIEKFERRAMVYESERQIKTFLLHDVYSGKEYLLPVKDEGLPIEVWEAFASKFEKDFTCEYDLLTERGIEIFFEEKLGYTPEIAVWHRGEDDVLLDIEFAHLGGMRYQIEAVYSEELEECVLTEEALEAFLDKNPECSVVPNFTWEQLINLLDFYHNW